MEKTGPSDVIMTNLLTENGNPTSVDSVAEFAFARLLISARTPSEKQTVDICHGNFAKRSLIGKVRMLNRMAKEVVASDRKGSDAIVAEIVSFADSEDSKANEAAASISKSDMPDAAKSQTIGFLKAFRSISHFDEAAYDALYKKNLRFFLGSLSYSLLFGD
jgi:hypothetical protein